VRARAPARVTDQVHLCLPKIKNRLAGKAKGDQEPRMAPDALISKWRGGGVAVAAAYGWEWPLSDDAILKRLFALNQERSAAGSG